LLQYGSSSYVFGKTKLPFARSELPDQPIQLPVQKRAEELDSGASLPPRIREDRSSLPLKSSSNGKCLSHLQRIDNTLKRTKPTIILSRLVIIDNEPTQDWKQDPASQPSCRLIQEQPETQTRNKRRQVNQESQLRQGNVCPEPQERNLPVIPSVKHASGSGGEIQLSLRSLNHPKMKQLQVPCPPSQQLTRVLRQSRMFLQSDLETLTPISALHQVRSQIVLPGSSRRGDRLPSTEAAKSWILSNPVLRVRV